LQNESRLENNHSLVINYTDWQTKQWAQQTCWRFLWHI